MPNAWRCTVLILLAMGAPIVSAQTNDHLYRSWSWSPVVGAPRATGLAGAFVAAADDASSVAVNPAGMVTLPKSEIAAAFYRTPSATSGVGDRHDGVTGVAFVGGTGRVGPRLAIGGYLTQPRKERMHLEPAPFPDGARYSGSLDASVTEGGGAVAYTIASRLSVGVRVTATRLTLEGAYTRTGSGDLGDLESGSAAGHTRITGSFGLLYGGVDDRLRLGFAARTGASYTVTRTANDPRIGGVDPGSEYELRQPASLAGGAALAVSPRLLLLGQVDFVRYSEIAAFVRPGTVTTGVYEAEDAVEPSLAAELSQPVGDWSVQVRGGLKSRGSGAITYSGPNAAEAVAFPPRSRDVLVAVGASLIQRGGFCLDVAALFGGQSTQYVGGARLRF